MTQIMWIIVINSLVGIFIAIPIFAIGLIRMIGKATYGDKSIWKTTDEEFDAAYDAVEDFHEEAMDIVEEQYKSNAIKAILDAILAIVLWEVYFPVAYKSIKDGI